MKHLYHTGDRDRERAHCHGCPCQVNNRFLDAPSGVCPFGETVEYREAVG